MSIRELPELILQSINYYTYSDREEQIKMKPQPGTLVHCEYRGSLVGTVIPDNDTRIWTNTLAFRGEPTQAQVDKHIEWCKANGLPFDNETAIDWGENCLRWDRTDSLSAA